MSGKSLGFVLLAVLVLLVVVVAGVCLRAAGVPRVIVRGLMLLGGLGFGFFLGCWGRKEID
jgi:hypothetical protein